jgi:hypothetical protein
MSLADNQDPASIVLDSTNVYYQQASQNLMRIPKGGGTPVPLATGQPGVFGISIDANNLYWAEHTMPGAIRKMPIGGGASTPIASGELDPNATAVDATSVYWVNFQGGTVKRVPIAGGTPVTLASGQDSPFAILVDDTNVYWATHHYSPPGPCNIMKLRVK